MQEAKHIAPCITCHAWNGDRTQVALCPNNTEIQIFAKDGKEFKLKDTLREHDQLVMGVDWATQTDRIVSCSQDRNAYVFTKQGNAWKPTLVILRINRAATFVKWSPQENKFAVASGAKLLSVCYFDEDNDWWVAKHIKRHRSTVVAVDWHPDNILLATGSTDFKCRIFSAFIRGPDKRGNQTLFGKDPKFGECLMEFDAGCGWVHDVAWTPAGTHLAYVSHDSCVNFVDNATDAASLSTLKFDKLPFRVIGYLSDSAVICAGYDYSPFLFLYNESEGWKLIGSVDQKPKEAAAKPTGARTANAFKMFQDKDSRGRVVAEAETKIQAQHQNAISFLTIQRDESGKAKTFTTTGIDGQLVIWSIAAIEQALSVSIG